ASRPRRAPRTSGRCHAHDGNTTGTDTATGAVSGTGTGYIPRWDTRHDIAQRQIRTDPETHAPHHQSAAPDQPRAPVTGGHQPTCRAPRRPTDAEVKICADESGQFRDPHTGLDGQREQGLVSAPE